MAALVRARARRLELLILNLIRYDHFRVPRVVPGVYEGVHPQRASVAEFRVKAT
jgi:hypothetical protein